MPNDQKFCLTLSILYSNEEELLSAFKIFCSWCREHTGSKKKYGMVKTSPANTKFFFTSTEFIPTWSLHKLFTAIEFGGQVTIEKSSSNSVV